MNQKAKKYLSILCVFFMLCSLMPTAAFAADEDSTSAQAIDLSKYKTTSYYYNGTIITADEEKGEDNDGNPIYAKSVIVGDGHIAAVAYTEEEAAILADTVQKYNCRRVDLNGKTMIPAFVDPHGHIDMVGQYFSASPANDIISLEMLVEQGKKDFNTWVNDHTYDDVYGTIEPGGKYWFVTHGFDNTAFKTNNFDKGEYAMPTKDILDKISTEYPIIYIHASNHLCGVNSLGLKLLSEKMDTLKTVAPQQYAYVNPEVNWDKDENGEYTGILREGGFYALYMVEPVLTDNSRTRIADAAGTLANAMDIYAGYGLTTAVAGGGKKMSALMAQIPRAERIIDVENVVGYDNKELMQGYASAAAPYDGNNLRHHCIKIFLDGSPQGKTAWFAVNSKDTVSGGGYYKDANEVLLDGKEHAWWYGEAEGKKVNEEKLTEYFVDCIQSGWQFTCHANGTGGIQEFIDSYRDALKHCGIDINDAKAIAEVQERIRPVIIHGQTITLEQVEECKKLGINISFFVDHVYYYGDYHLCSTLGPERGQLISPMADAMEGDKIMVTVHQDAPISTPDMVFSIYNAATRITRDGQAIGRGSANGSSDSDARITDWQNKKYDTRDERISAYEALKCATINSAWQNFEENQKGSISVGKQADFVILSVNILSDEFLGMTPMEAKAGTFVEKTINNGKVIYQK